MTTPDHQLRERYAEDVFGDYRRAAAFITHHHRGDGDGVVAVMAEAGALGRGDELLLAVCGLFRMVVPNLISDDVTERIQRLTVQWAADEHSEPNPTRGEKP